MSYSTTNIEWTDATWNPVTGCTGASRGCLNCYARTMTRRLQGMQPKYAKGFDEVVCHDNELGRPFHWRQPRDVFVCSMSDLFQDGVPFEFAAAVIGVMQACPQHVFQTLTKRPERQRRFHWWLRDMGLDVRAKVAPLEPFVCRAELQKKLSAALALPATWPPRNWWQGTTVEHADYRGRIDELRYCPATIRFLSCEPLLSALPDLNLTDVDWVIVGGESGPGARPMQPDWVRDIRDQCQAARVPFFFKRWGACLEDGTTVERRRKNRAKPGRLLDGREWNERPDRAPTEAAVRRIKEVSQ